MIRFFRKGDVTDMEKRESWMLGSGHALKDQRFRFWPGLLFLFALIGFFVGCIGPKATDPAPTAVPTAAPTEAPTETPTEAPTGKPEPDYSAYQLYWNLDDVSKLGADTGRSSRSFSGGKAEIDYLTPSGTVRLYVTERAILNQLDQNPFLMLKTEPDGRITDVVDVAEAGYRDTCVKWFVQDAPKNGILTLWSDTGFNAMKYELNLSECPGLSAVEEAGEIGKPVTDFSQRDRVTVIEDPDGKPVFAFITLHQVLTHHHDFFGAESEDGVAFEAWTETTKLPSSSGYYYLDADVTLKADYNLPESAKVVLCLNGHTIRLEGVRLCTFNPNSALTLCDCDGNGLCSFVGQTVSAQKVGGIWARYGEVNIYGGTYDFSDFHNTYNSGCNGVATTAGASFSMYGGHIIGGRGQYYPEFESEHGLSGYRGGGALLNRGYAAIYGGVIEGAASKNGGNIYNLGTLLIEGGEILNGDAYDGFGGNIFNTLFFNHFQRNFKSANQIYCRSKCR